MFEAPRSLDPKLRPQLLEDMLHVHSLAVATDVDDRSLAIIGTAFLESILTEAIAVRLPVLDEDVRRTLFDPHRNAPLSTFAAKVHMARAMKAVAGIAYEDLKLIGRIRNEFAHNVRVDRFDHVNVLKYVNRLKKQSQLDSFDQEFNDIVDVQKLYENIFLKSKTPRGNFACSMANIANGLFNIAITDAGFGAACLL
jgi:hypothetical protein